MQNVEFDFLKKQKNTNKVTLKLGFIKTKAERLINLKI